MSRRSLVAACPTLALALCMVHGAPAGAASKLVVAALGGAAPGGGVFAGPSFVGEPSLASGWLAFRGQITEGKTSEQLVVENLNTRQRTTVASVGGAISADIGKVKQFLGRPTVNARGDVAFAALINLPDDVKVDPTRPPAGGIFLYSQGTITAIVAPGDNTGLGFLDLATPITFADDVNAVDIAERTPALNDSGDVAFVATVQDENGKSSGAIFLKRAGQALVPVLKLNDPYLDGKFDVLGPPALNNAGTLAFRGSVTGAATLDGVFKLEGGTLSLLVRDGAVLDTITDPKPFPIDPVAEFGVVVALNDQGDVACTGGPLFDNSEHASLNDIDGSPGVILIPNQGTPLLVGYPGQPRTVGDVTQGVVSDLTLGPDAGSRVAPPSLMPSGEVVFFAQTNGGSSQGILRANPVARSIRRLVTLGGGSADTTPVGGTYQSASSAPAVDASGGLAFSARIEGATTSEALFYLPPAGTPEAISIGDATDNGFFGGPAFSPPQMNDAGDVVFKSYVAKGPASLGMFRYSQGQLAANPVVRVGGPAPIAGSPPFTNLVGDPSVNAKGDVAFAATVGGKGRGIFVWSAADGTLRTVAMPQVDVVLAPPDPQRQGPLFRSIASNPSLSDSGAVAFRATLQYQNPIDPFLGDVKEDGVFLVDETGTHLVAAQGQDSGVGAPFLSFRDPVIQGESILFRARLDTENEPQGLFVFDQPAGRRPVAVEDGDLGGMTLKSLLGRGVFDAAGDIVFPARIDSGQGSTGTILRRTAGGFATLVRTDDRGPEGGSIRSIGRPSVSSTGHVAFRLAFFPFSGGAPGLFLAAGDPPLQPYLRVGEVVVDNDDRNGRVTTFNQNVALNRLDEVALLASIGSSKSGSAILLAAPAKLSVQRLAFRRGPSTLIDASVKPKDQVQFSALLKPGKLPGIAATKKTKLGRVALTVAVADTKGTLWSANLSDKDVRVRGRTLIAKSGAAKLRTLRVQATRDGIRVAVRSAPLDFTKAPGLRQFDDKSAVILEPPFTVRVDVGADGGADTLRCSQKPRRFRCGG